MDNRNRTRLAISAAAVLVLLLLVGVFWLLSSSDRAEQPTIADTTTDSAKAGRPPAGEVVAGDGEGAKQPETKVNEAAPEPEEARKPEDTRPEGEVAPKHREDGEEIVPGEEPKPKVDGEETRKPVEGEDGYKPDPEKPITVDFVNRDVQTVMHYIALRSGLNVIMEGSITTKLTVMFRDKKPREIIRQICEANNLEMTESGDSIMVKNR